MRLLSLHIENFRALESMDLVLHPMTVIIGENDVGKSSCMLAVKTLFECKKIDHVADLFMCQQNREVVIEATFQVDTPTAEQESYVTGVDQLSVRCKYRFEQPRETEVLSVVPCDSRLREIDKQKADDLRKTLQELEIVTPSDKPDKAASQQLLRDFVATKLPPERFEKNWVGIKEIDFAKLMPDFVLVPVARDLDRNLKMTENSLMGKLFRPLLKEALQGEGVESSLSAIRNRLKDGVLSKVEELQLLLRAQLNNEQVILTHQIDFDPMGGISFDFGMDDERVQGIPMSNRGAGVHNNLILAMFRLLAEHGPKNFVLAIEEPENSLHPRGQREMLWALQAISKTAQVICTTHSSVFLDLGLLEDNIVLTRTSRGNTISRSFRSAKLKELRELLGIRISDALLSGGGNAAIIVEGPTELNAYPHFFRMCGLNARALGISIVSAEGSNFDRIRRLLLVLNEYDIPSVVVLDKDAAETGKDLNRLIENKTMPCLQRVFVLKEGKFETYIPLDIAVAVINERFLDGDAISATDIDQTKDREREFERVIYEKKGVGARFEHFKVQFGELAGKKMSEAGAPLPRELEEIVKEVGVMASAV